MGNQALLATIQANLYRATEQTPGQTQFRALSRWTRIEARNQPNQPTWSTLNVERQRHERPPKNIR